MGRQVGDARVLTYPTFGGVVQGEKMAAAGVSRGWYATPNTGGMQQSPSPSRAHREGKQRSWR
ncbi:MAG: hypothetical protein LBJ57_02205 [Prevotellaceae bacterium]|nr:hypothetical protein [Prevotellaceae bacterium]